MEDTVEDGNVNRVVELLIVLVPLWFTAVNVLALNRPSVAETSRPAHSAIFLKQYKINSGRRVIYEPYFDFHVTRSTDNFLYIRQINTV